MLNNSGDKLSSDCVLAFSNRIGRSFINKLKSIVPRISPCLSPVDVLNGVETKLFRMVVSILIIYYSEDMFLLTVDLFQVSFMCTHPC